MHVIEPSAQVPEHIALLLNEWFDLDDPISVRKKIRGMAGELRDQAELSFASQYERVNVPDQFRVVLSGGLDLFAKQGACQAPACRLEYVDRIGRSVGLLADELTIHDHFGYRFLKLRTRSTLAQMDEFVADLYVLKKMAPLIRAGLVNFMMPSVLLCQGCKTGFDEEVAATSSALLEKVKGDLVVRDVAGGYEIDTGPLYSPSLVISISRSEKSELSANTLVREIVDHCVSSALRSARDASSIGGVVFSNSRVGINGLLHQDGQRLSADDLDYFVSQRAAELPWVNGLNIQQMLRLREDSGDALPALRSFLARKLAGKSAAEAAKEDLGIIEELKEQALLVRGELERSTSKSNSLRRTSTGLMGLGIAALSVACGKPSFEAVGGLLTTLGLLHQMPAPNAIHEAELKARPGYVLLAAQKILSHGVSASSSRARSFIGKR